MKRTIIALSVAAAVALPVAAQAAPKVYGKINLSAEQYKFDYDTASTGATTANFLDADYTRLVSNASRFGVKGEDELTATLSAVYGIEWEVGTDGEDLNGSATYTSSGKADLTQRNRFVGIKSTQFGAIKLGKYDSYLKQAQGEVDLFNDLAGDFKYILAGENRLNNTIGYESPSLAGVVISVQTQTQDGSNTGAGGSATTVANQPNRKNGTSASVVYKNDDLGLYAALAADFGIDSATALFGTRESDNLRAVVSYKIAALTLNGIYQTSDDSRPGQVNQKESGWQLGAAYKLGDETLKAQYGEVSRDVDATTAGNDKTVANNRVQWSVGVDHNFTSNTKAFLFYTAQEEEGWKDGNPTATNTPAKGDYTSTVAGIGIDHKF